MIIETPIRRKSEVLKLPTTTIAFNIDSMLREKGLYSYHGPEGYDYIRVIHWQMFKQMHTGDHANK